MRQSQHRRYVAIMRKLMHIFFGILKNEAPFDENLAFAH
jgi:hypothetical protein